SIIASGTGAPSPSSTRPSITMRWPCGLPRVRSAQSGRTRPRAKNGPTVCPGVAIALVAIGLPVVGLVVMVSVPAFQGSRVTAAQHHVEGVAQGPFGLAQLGVVVGDETPPRRLVGGALVDRVVLQQRVAREIHLGD